jgi:hypothetical protein
MTKEQWLIEVGPLWVTRILKDEFLSALVSIRVNSWLRLFLICRDFGQDGRLQPLLFFFNIQGEASGRYETGGNEDD